jgi:hypothetical protein
MRELNRDAAHDVPRVVPAGEKIGHGAWRVGRFVGRLSAPLNDERLDFSIGNCGELRNSASKKYQAIQTI